MYFLFCLSTIWRHSCDCWPQWRDVTLLIGSYRKSLNPRRCSLGICGETAIFFSSDSNSWMILFRQEFVRLRFTQVFSLSWRHCDVTKPSGIKLPCSACLPWICRKGWFLDSWMYRGVYSRHEKSLLVKVFATKALKCFVKITPALSKNKPYPIIKREMIF